MVAVIAQFNHANPQKSNLLITIWQKRVIYRFLFAAVKIFDGEWRA
jgi:hypothetical protein